MKIYEVIPKFMPFSSPRDKAMYRKDFFICTVLQQVFFPGRINGLQDQEGPFCGWLSERVSRDMAFFTPFFGFCSYSTY